MKSKNFSRFLKPTHLNLEFIERVLVALTSLILIMISFFLNEKQKQIKVKMHEALSPVYSIVSIPNNYLNLFFDSLNNYTNLRSTNEILMEKLIASQEDLNELHHYRVENQQLKNLLNVQAPPPSKKLVSRIILDPSDIYSSNVYIDSGLKHGISYNAPVFNENGFLGRVIDVAESISEVLLISDPRSSLPVISEISKIKFFVEGNFENLKIKHKSSDADFIDGESVISTGASGYFKSGIIVGRIKMINQKIRVIPNAKKNDSVYVMTLGYDLLRKYPEIE